MEFVKEMAQRLRSVREEILELNHQYYRAADDVERDQISSKLQNLEEEDFYIWESVEESGLADEVDKEIGVIEGW